MPRHGAGTLRGVHCAAVCGWGTFPPLSTLSEWEWLRVGHGNGFLRTVGVACLRGGARSCRMLRDEHPLPALRHGVRSLAGGHGLPLAPLFPCRSPQSRVTPGHGSQHWQTAEHLGARRRHLAGAEGPAEYTLSPSDRPIRLACYSRMPELVTMPALITWEPRAEGVSVCLILTAWPEGLS